MRSCRKLQILFFLAGLVALSLICSSGTFAQDHNPAHPRPRREVPVDGYNSPVLTPKGERINYTKEQFEKSANSVSSPATEVKSSPSAAVEKMSGGAVPASSLLASKKKFGIFGSVIGGSGISIQDLDKDGKVEVVMAGSSTTFGSNDFWYILDYQLSGATYAMKWQSRFYQNSISRIVLLDPDNDGYPSIFVCQSDGVIEIFDGRTLEVTDTITIPAGTIRQVFLADADNDVAPEIVVGTDSAIRLYNPATLALEHQIPYGANDFEVGNVDADPANEIVLSSGYVLEFDGVSTTVAWNYGEAFGYLVELSDIDNDGMEEIVAASTWYYVTAFDADITSPKWLIPADQDVDALLVVDVDNDGASEVLYGDGQWGKVHCFDGLTGTNEEWTINNPEHGVTNIAVYDTDQDGKLEIVWSAGATSTGADYLYVYGTSPLISEWQSTHEDGPFHALDVGDVDGDGGAEIVFASFESNSGYDDGYLFVYDALTLALKWQSPLNMFERNAWTGIHAVKIGDVDNDGVMEILVGTDDLYNGVIYVINGQSYALERKYTFDTGAPIYTLEIADVDNDNQPEIIAGGGREHTGAPGVYIYVINGATGAVEWKSISLGNYWSDFYALRVGDIDGDGTHEIIATNDNLFVFDGITHQMWKSTDGNVYTALDLSDMDGDLVSEIVAGTIGGTVAVIDGQSYATEATYLVAPARIDSLELYDIEKKGSRDIIFSGSGMLQVYDIGSSKLIWKSEYLGENAGDFDALKIYQFNGGEAIDVVVGTPINLSLFSTNPDYKPTYSIIDWYMLFFLNSIYGKNKP